MLKKILLVLGCLLLLAALGVGYLIVRKPAQAAPLDIKVAMTPERIERGLYVFSYVADCGGCHSQRDFTKVGGPEILAGRGKGNLLSDVIKDMPGTVVAPNITPDRETGIGSWTDGEKIRAIREGVDREGNALFPMMPYATYGRLSDDDVQSLVAYLNSLTPIRNPLPKTQIKFPVNVLIKGVPKPVGSVPPVDKSDQKKYGEFLAEVAGCVGCHTAERGRPSAGKTLAGGETFDTSFGKVVSANITPDMETGIGKWSQEFFIKKFRDYKEYADHGAPPLPGPQSFTLMPWLAYSQRTDEDLAAIYAYLRTFPAVSQAVDSHPGYPKSPEGKSPEVK